MAGGDGLFVVNVQDCDTVEINLVPAHLLHLPHN